MTPRSKLHRGKEVACNGNGHGHFLHLFICRGKTAAAESVEHFAAKAATGKIYPEKQQYPMLEGTDFIT